MKEETTSAGDNYKIDRQREERSGEGELAGARGRILDDQYGIERAWV